MKKIAFLILTTSLIFGCTKDKNINPITSGNNSSSVSELSEKEITPNDKAGPIKGNRQLHAIGAGDEIVDIWCSPPNGSCLDDVVVSGATAKLYNELLAAIEADAQDQFFIAHDYTDVFPITYNHMIQDQLEKGHIKIKLVKMGDTDFNLFIKPQHEKFEGPKLVNKVVLTIPVVK